MRCQLSVLLGLVLTPLALSAQGSPPAPSRADSALVLRILSAEDQRDSLHPALAEGMASRNSAIQLLARRARARITDPKFAVRDSLPPLPPPPAYADPAWRLRFRALATRPVDCAKLSAALADSAWAVRLRAVDLATADCRADRSLVATLREWTAKVPSSARRSRGAVSWHAAAHAIVALARMSPDDARPLVPRFAASTVPAVRAYAARAATVIADTNTLRRLGTDRDDNVKEAAIDGLSKVAGHSADAVYLSALAAPGYQAIRAAANALKGSTDSAHIRAAAGAAWRRLAVSSLETARDARVAVADRLREVGAAPTDTIRVPRPAPPGRDAVALALGREYRIRVTLADSSGGGSFIVRLRGDVAPIMGARVLQLVREGWYNGRTWYRVEPDFVIQGGGPGSNEYVGHPRFMRDELSALPQVRGTVGMSTRGHDTGDAQWFVNLRDNQRLTRDYTAWGEIIDGIDVVDGILEGDVIARMEILPARPHD